MFDQTWLALANPVIKTNPRLIENLVPRKKEFFCENREKNKRLAQRVSCKY